MRACLGGHAEPFVRASRAAGRRSGRGIDKRREGDESSREALLLSRIRRKVRPREIRQQCLPNPGVLHRSELGVWVWLQQGRSHGTVSLHECLSPRRSNPLPITCLRVACFVVVPRRPMPQAQGLYTEAERSSSVEPLCFPARMFAYWTTLIDKVN